MYYSYNKYGNKKITRNGITFDSIHEADVYCTLVWRERIGEISNLRRQVPYELLPNQYKEVETVLKSGKIKISKKLVERSVTYIADFVYFDNTLQKEIVVDAKGVKTDTYKIKKKLMYYFHGIEIQEI